MSNCVKDLYDYDLDLRSLNVEVLHWRVIFIKTKLKMMDFNRNANVVGKNIMKVVKIDY